MPESVESTYEEATRCPKCGKPGDVRSKQAAPKTLLPGTQIHHVYCITELCRWYNTAWMVQVNRDGSVPPPTNHTGRNKMYIQDKDADRMAAEIRASIDRQIEIETQHGGHGEVRGR
jgi:hypothetical protein